MSFWSELIACCILVKKNSHFVFHLLAYVCVCMCIAFLSNVSASSFPACSKWIFRFNRFTLKERIAFNADIYRYIYATLTLFLLLLLLLILFISISGYFFCFFFPFLFKTRMKRKTKKMNKYWMENWSRMHIICIMYCDCDMDGNLNVWSCISQNAMFTFCCSFFVSFFSGFCVYFSLFLLTFPFECIQ